VAIAVVKGIVRNTMLDLRGASSVKGRHGAYLTASSNDTVVIATVARSNFAPPTTKRYGIADHVAAGDSVNTTFASIYVAFAHPPPSTYAQTSAVKL
jgi:hypothetical protein